MTLLEIVNKFCKVTALPSVITAIGSTNTQTSQIVALLEEELIDLASRHQWQVLTKIVNFTSIDSEDQGEISTIAEGFSYISNNTFWDLSNNVPITGPLTGQQWQEIKAVFNNGPRYQYRMANNKLLINPVPEAGLSWVFEATTKNPIIDAAGATTKSAFSEDTDVLLLNECLALLGLRWRWKREKGLDYAELFNMYEFQVKEAIGRDGGAQNISMEDSKAPTPGVFVPAGNWITP